MCKWKVVFILVHESIILSHQSISGVTFMDDFDFEDRYRNIHECDPMYWHPLHLPSYCINMYEKLIRTGLSRDLPMTIVKHKTDYPFQMENVFTYDKIKNDASCDDSDDEPERKRYYKRKHGTQKNTYKYKTLKYDIPAMEVVNAVETEQVRVMPGKSILDFYTFPYQRMLDALRQDVANDPPKPTIEVLPNIGPVVLYKQPVSRNSEMIIKTIAEAYQKANQQIYGNGDKDEYEVIAKKDGKDMLAVQNEKPTKIEKLKDPMTPILPNKKPKNKNLQRKKIVKNNMVAIIEQKKIN